MKNNRLQVIEKEKYKRGIGLGDKTRNLGDKINQMFIRS
jgi:hypothetical protein